MTGLVLAAYLCTTGADCNMWVTLKDQRTGEVRECPDKDFSPYWWMEGNGSDDCNRVLAFGGKDLEKQYRRELGLGENYCLGAQRFVVVDVHGDMEDYTKEEIMSGINQDYGE